MQIDVQYWRCDVWEIYFCIAYMRAHICVHTFIICAFIQLSPSVDIDSSVPFYSHPEPKTVIKNLVQFFLQIV